jgi:hypothetical protein
MTTPDTPLLARLQSLLDGVALNPGMVEASNLSRWREALAVMMEMAEMLLAAQDEIAQQDNRIRELEAWREDMRRGGK